MKEGRGQESGGQVEDRGRRGKQTRARKMGCWTPSGECCRHLRRGRVKRLKRSKQFEMTWRRGLGVSARLLRVEGASVGMGRSAIRLR
jgi:hypothetical protein